ncbi:MAG TPA: FAD-dependent oxidoreductase, partial [Thermomicrobiales bacterium]|nr:FAD-dependent oxidoreductase [Thermomicrobiales bacterium]
MPRADVIVVGAGVAGCSTAYRLAEQGRKVLVIDQRGIASGASGRNCGITGVGSALHGESGKAVYAMTVANLKLLRTLAEELDADFELTLPGSINVATTGAQLAHLRAGVATQQAAGVTVEMLDADEARRHIPALSDAILGAEYTQDAGHLWPFRLVHGFAENAKRHGATFRLGERVTGLIRKGDRVLGVQIGDEAIEADEVVLCSNAYTPQILPDLPSGSIVPARGQILVTQVLPPILPIPFGTNFDKEYGRQTPDGKILCGGFRRLDVDEGLGHYEEHVSGPVQSGIASCLTTLFPRIGAVRVVRCWA